MWILGDKEKAPLQGVCRGVGSRCEQVQCDMKKVIVVIEIVDVSVLNTDN